MSDVSVLIPAYNSEIYIRRCIDSVLNQTIQPSEIIVIDDLSTDSTVEIARSYGGIVKVISNDKNLGPSMARNNGIDVASSKWIAFIDSDDEWEPEKNEMALTTVSKLDTQWCMVARKEARKDKIPTTYYPKNGDMLRINYFSLTLQGKGCAPSSTMVMKSVFDATGGFNNNLSIGEDQEMWWRIACIFPYIGYYSKPLVRYYVDIPGSLTNSKKDDVKLVAFWDSVTNIRLPPSQENAELFIKVRNAFASKAIRAYIKNGNYNVAGYVNHKTDINPFFSAKLLLILPKTISRLFICVVAWSRIGRIRRLFTRRW